MSPILIKGVVTLGGAFATGAGIWGAYKLVEPKTIREKLEGEGKTFLSVEEGSDDAEWKKLYESNSSASSDKIEVDTASEDNDKSKKMREKCRELLGKKVSESNDTEIGKVRTRCSRQQG